MFQTDAKFFELTGSMALAKSAGDVADPHGRRVIEGVASTDARDMQGESVDSMGLDFSYFARHGRLNWDHAKGPGDIIGEPVKWNQKPDGVYLWGLLYAGLKRADEAYALLKAGATLAWSLEGKVMERDPADPTRVIKAAVINCAVTHNPVCTETWCKLSRGDVAKSIDQAGADVLHKTLDTGSGAVLTPQALEGSVIRRHASRCKAGCGCMEKGAGGLVFRNGYRGAIAHFTNCCEAPLDMAVGMADRHEAIAMATAEYLKGEER